MPTKFKPEFSDVLKSYVYVYIDPRNGRPFYVGKGKGSRLIAHLKDRSESKKVMTIRALQKVGREPQIVILRHGMNDDQAALVEAAAIELLGIPPLTNQCHGFHKRSFGRISYNDFALTFTAKPADIRHSAILITINKLYHSDMSPKELYEATRGIWKVGPRREGAEIAMPVYRGVIREVYRIQRWQPAGTSRYDTRDSSSFKGSGRWEFAGDVDETLHDWYVGKSVRNHVGQNPVRYVRPT